VLLFEASLCLEMLILRNHRVDFALGMVSAPSDVERLVYVSSMPCATIKSNAKVGFRLFAGAVELTRTLLSGPPN
jgi:hypothetical protein